eukprot:TRINITY_DN5606_c0_g1_i4.p2 TRINITY_DN5606_c0_g1~~TRINITY_DN5606_c0_g1_i4.p2  ORF type:complete len:349 (-),score=32.26 TRINITY_DN5606_c0_g1_i4:911-1876(-)
MGSDLLHALDCQSRYHMLKRLGSGASGNVLLCVDSQTEKYVAIKFIPRGPDNVTKYVCREIMNHRQLQHEHVVRYQEVFVTEKFLAIVMEYADQGDLQEYVVERTGLTENEARWFFQQLIIAVDFCHKKNVVIRDIKLENILLVKRGKDYLIKLCDFGYSKNRASHSYEKTRVGTPAYLAPEVIRSVQGQTYDGRLADVWSCGVGLFVMLTCCLPFERESDKQLPQYQRLNEMLRRIVEHDFFVPKQLGLSQECIDLLHGILENDVNKRLTIQQILQHPWFVKGLPKGVLEWNQKALRRQPTLKQTDQEVMSLVLTAQQTS